MWQAQKRRARDRKFIPYAPEKHLVRAYAVSASDALTWDLFPPIQGYRPFNAKAERSCSVSPKRQHSDWAKLVIQRDKHKCQECGADADLEAHHIWPQSWFPQLRYILKNGTTLCRRCHDVAYFASEITPGQFEALTSEVVQINSNIEASDFWERYTAGLEKGRVFAYQLLSVKEMSMSAEEEEWFVSWAALNDFLVRSERAVREAPLEDRNYKISQEMVQSIKSHEHHA